MSSRRTDIVDLEIEDYDTIAEISETEDCRDEISSNESETEPESTKDILK